MLSAPVKTFPKAKFSYHSKISLGSGSLPLLPLAVSSGIPSHCRVWLWVPYWTLSFKPSLFSLFPTLPYIAENSGLVLKVDKPSFLTPTF